MSASMLVRGRWVIPGAEDAVLSDGAVLVEGDAIAAVDDFETLRRQHPQATVVGSDHSAILPGFVNAHHHSHATTTIGHGVSDDLLEPWILSFAPMRQPDVYLNTLLSCVRQLRSGVTTVVDVHGSRGNAEQYAASVDAGLRAYEQAGLRVAFTTGRTMQCFLVHGKDQDQVFLDGLPAELRQRAASLLPPAGQGFSGEDYLDIVEERVRRYQDHPRIDVWFGPPGPQWVSDELMQQIADRASALDTAVQTHCVESFYEMLHGPRFYGQPTVLHLRDLGVLSERFSLAHGVWLKPAELEVLAETGAAVSHNPSSNLRLRAGIAPLNAMLEAGMTVGLGMDGTTLNEDEDMFTEMRLGLRLHRTPQLGGTVPSPQVLFDLATAGGARLMRKDATIGRIAPGYQADLVVIDLERISWPWLAPEVDPRELVLMQAQSRDVDTVLVAGEVVLADGLPTRFDLHEAAQALAEQLGGQDYGHEAAKLVADLNPHLLAWYRGWESGTLDPYIRYNSKS